MKGRFKGENLSMGFIKGKTYELRSEVRNNLIFLFDKNSPKYCPYSSMETVLQNCDFGGIVWEN